MVKSNKSSISSKKHEDRELAGKTAFEASTVEIQTPQTMILLLASKEDMVVLKVISSLDKYASRLEQNAQVLFEAGILKLLRPLLDHTELYIKRFATKLLSELNYLPDVADILLEEEIIPFMMEVLNSSTDFVIKEFASSIIAELTRSNIGLNQLLKSKLIASFPSLLKVPDPDIQKNCLQIISNMVQDNFNHSTLTQQTDFDIKTFMDLLLSEYVAIQNLTLDVLDNLTRQTKGNRVPTEFQNVGGVALLLKILKNFEWIDIHGKCLDVLCNIYNDPCIAQHFLRDGVLQLFNYIKFINDAQLRKKAVEAIAKIAETPLGRKMLAESGHIPELEAMLLEQSAGLAGAVSGAISCLVQDYQALQQVLECEIVKDLLTVVADESQGWENKAEAVNALYQVLRRDINACSAVVDLDKVNVIASVLNQFNEGVPAHAAVSAANCITAIANVPELKQRIVNKHLISSLLHCFEDLEKDTTPVKLAACEALCSLLSEPETRTLLRDMDGLSVVWASITKQPNNTQFLQAAANFVHLCVANDVSFTNNLLQLDAINWLLSQRSFRNECPAWEVALETVLNKFLPLKFAMTGRLDLTDVTENGFYITRVGLTQEQLKMNKFPNISDIIENKCCPSLTLYFANFTDIHNNYNGSGSLKFSTGTSSPSKMSSTGSSSTLSSSLDCNKFWLADHYLQNYLQSLSSILEQNGFSAEDTKRRDSVVDGETISKKAMLIGQFVANQMSGLDASEVCSSHTLDLHINEIKVEIMNNMIPIGWMRTGLHLERAFLFKVLADKLGLPASLVRGTYLQRAWIEVPIPNIPPAPRPAYPNYLLKPNFIVDLMSSPGTLYPLKSYESDVYCGHHG